MTDCHTKKQFCRPKKGAYISQKNLQANSSFSSKLNTGNPLPKSWSHNLQGKKETQKQNTVRNTFHRKISCKGNIKRKLQVNIEICWYNLDGLQFLKIIVGQKKFLIRTLQVEEISCCCFSVSCCSSKILKHFDLPREGHSAGCYLPDTLCPKSSHYLTALLPNIFLNPGTLEILNLAIFLSFIPFPIITRPIIPFCSTPVQPSLVRLSPIHSSPNHSILS